MEMTENTPQEHPEYPIEHPEYDLLPCPFCGREAEVVYDNDHQVEFFSLGCPQGPCPAFHIFYMEPISEIGDAVMWWNRRETL
jgi:hypothetical protein